MPNSVPIEVLRRCLAHVRHGLTIADARLPDLPLIYVNQAFEAMTGYSSAELVGRNCRLLQRDDRRQAGVKTLRAARASNQPARVTLRNYRKDGTLFWSDLSLTPIFDEQGQLTHYIGLQEDVTQQRQERAKILSYQRRLRVLAQRLIDMEAAERNKIAEEVHDQMAQTLALCRMQLSQLASELGNQTSRAKAEEIRGLVETALSEARGLIAELSAPLLRELGLVAALHNVAERLAKRYALAVQIDAEIGHTPVPDTVAHLVFRAARELVTNVGKHAAAQSVQLSLTRKDRDLVLTVVDDGKGLLTRQHVELGVGGFGLMSVRERAVYLGGALTVSHPVGKGTRVVLSLPLERFNKAIATRGAK